MDFRRQQRNFYQVMAPRELFVFSGAYTGDPFADLATGIANATEQDFLQGIYPTRYWDLSEFVQDDFRIRSNLTLNISQGPVPMPSPEASRRNLQKARAGWQPPQRSEGIKHLVRQWQISTAPKESGRALARRLGVSHTYVHKVVRKFLSELPWPRVPIQEVETPCADAALKALKHEQKIPPTREPKLDVPSDWGERARDEHLREYGEFLARGRPRMRRFIPGRSRFVP